MILQFLSVASLNIRDRLQKTHNMGWVYIYIYIYIYIYMGWVYIYIWGGYIKRVRERERDLQTNFQKTVVLEATILIINTHMHEVFLINTFAFLLKNGIHCFDLV